MGEGHDDVHGRLLREHAQEALAALLRAEPGVAGAALAVGGGVIPLGEGLALRDAQLELDSYKDIF